MISLQQPTEPFEIVISEEIVFTVKPLDTFLMGLAQEKARSMLSRLQVSASDVIAAGLVPDRELNLSDENEKNAYYHRFLIAALAENHIVSWTGIDCDVNVENAKAMVVGLFPIGDIFYHQLTKIHFEVLKAKKDCGTAANGISVAVPNTVTDAESPEVPALTESQD